MRWQTVLLALALGFVTTLMVPRVMRWMSRQGLLSPAQITFADWRSGDLNRYEETDCTHLYWTGRTVSTWSGMPGATELLGDVASGSVSFVEFLGGFRGTGLPAIPSAASMRAEVQVIAQGFPFRCTWGWTRTLTPALPGAATPQGDEGGIIRIRINGATFQLTCLPLWPGLIANGLVYSGLWFGGFAYARFARRRGRTHRGLCAACGYSREGLEVGAPCPECGVRR